MAVTAKQVNELRQLTGAPLMRCKQVLIEVGGDIDQAKAMIKEQGLSVAAKKSTRETTQGLVLAEKQDDVAIIIEIMCETDFVARNSVFQDFAHEVLKVALAHKVGDIDSLMELKVSGMTVEQMRQEQVAGLGENIQVLSLIHI